MQAVTLTGATLLASAISRNMDPLVRLINLALGA